MWYNPKLQEQWSHEVCAESWLGEKKNPLAAPEPMSAFLPFRSCSIMPWPHYYLSSMSVGIVSGWLSQGALSPKRVCAESWLWEKRKLPQLHQGRSNPCHHFCYIIWLLCCVVTSPTCQCIWFQVGCTAVHVANMWQGSKERLLGHKHTIINNI